MPRLSVYTVVDLRLFEATLLRDSSPDDTGSAAEEKDAAPAQPPQKRPRISVPTPHFASVATYDADFPEGVLPSASYVRHRKLTIEEEKRRVTYDADSLDLNWLRSHALFGEAVEAECRLSVPQFELLIDVMEKATGQRDGILLTEAEAVALILDSVPAEAMPLRLRAAAEATLFPKMMSTVYLYWTQKRSRHHKPLLRKYWSATSIEDTNPYMVFRPNEKERYKLRKHRKNDMLSFVRLQQLQRELVEARKIVALISTREGVKNELMRFNVARFEQRLHVLRHSTEKGPAPLRELGVVLRAPRPPPPPPTAVSAAANAALAAAGAKRARVSGGSAASSPSRRRAASPGPYAARHRVRITRFPDGSSLYRCVFIYRYILNEFC